MRQILITHRVYYTTNTKLTWRNLTQTKCETSPIADLLNDFEVLLGDKEQIQDMCQISNQVFFLRTKPFLLDSAYLYSNIYAVL